jgi:hypothetical protein
MSNVFKSNSRFASLIEENKNDNNVNRVSPSRADRPNNFNRQRNNYDTGGLRRESVVEKKKLYLLNESNFPELCTTSLSKKVQQNDVTFLDKLNSRQSEDNTKDEIYIEPGCVVISLDAKTRRSTFVYGESTINNKTEDDIFVDPYDVLNALVDLHEQRTNDYIDLWGYDEYEKEFLCKNYDYNYFDRLDEEYEEEMLRNIENNKDEYEYE